MKYVLTLLIVMTQWVVLAQKDKKLTEKTVSKEKIMSHIYFLASDEMKGRDTGSDELKIAAQYLKTQLQLFGVKPLPEYPDYLQPVSLQKTTPPKDGSIIMDSTEFQVGEDFIMLAGGELTWTGDFVFLEYATKEEISNTDVEGKIIVTNCGNGKDNQPRAFFMAAAEKRKNAAESGAVGLIELYNSAQLPFSVIANYLGGERTSLAKDDAEDLPHAWLNNANNDIVKAIKDKNLQNVAVDIKGKEVDKFTSYNVVGYIPGTEFENEYVVYSAHYDHVGIGQPDSTGDDIYNGARDNAIGTVTVLSAAENIGQYPTKRSALFILFTAEEKGLLGSEWFVENTPVTLDEIVYCFNSDGGGYNDTGKATIIGLERTTAEEVIMESCEAFGIEAIQDQMPEQNLFDRSDNVNFAKKGIPAPTFSPGVTAFDQEILKYYHQPADNPESLDYDYLFKFFSAYVYSARQIGNLKSPPFWVEGDKYYDAGVDLYNK